MAWWGTVACVVLGLAVAASCWGALAVGEGPGRLTTYAGSSGLAAALTIASGGGLGVAGLVAAFGGSRRIGVLALLAGLTWFAPAWVGWEQGPLVIRSIGMVAAGFFLPVVVHVALAYPAAGRPLSPPERWWSRRTSRRRSSRSRVACSGTRSSTRTAWPTPPATRSWSAPSRTCRARSWSPTSGSRSPSRSPWSSRAPRGWRAPHRRPDGPACLWPEPPWRSWSPRRRGRSCCCETGWRTPGTRRSTASTSSTARPFVLLAPHWSGLVARASSTGRCRGRRQPGWGTGAGIPGSGLGPRRR